MLVSLLPRHAQRLRVLPITRQRVSPGRRQCISYIARAMWLMLRLVGAWTSQDRVPIDWAVGSQRRTPPKSMISSCTLPCSNATISLQTLKIIRQTGLRQHSTMPQYPVSLLLSMAKRTSRQRHHCHTHQANTFKECYHGALSI